MDKRTLTTKEQAYVDKYQKDTQVGPFPVQFVTVDSLVIHRERLLLIQRKGVLGFGDLALPGGFVNPTELLIDAAIRECKEETGVDVDKKWLKYSQVFDEPTRSPLGRVISHGYVFRVPDELQEPVATAGDDAERAVWINRYAFISQWERVMFQDHYSLVKTMLEGMDKIKG